MAASWGSFAKPYWSSPKASRESSAALPVVLLRDDLVLYGESGR